MDEDPLKTLFESMTARTTAARERYAPIVRRLTNEEFIGIFLAVMDERQRRLIDLMAINPAILQAAINDLNKKES